MSTVPVHEYSHSKSSKPSGSYGSKLVVPIDLILKALSPKS